MESWSSLGFVAKCCTHLDQMIVCVFSSACMLFALRLELFFAIILAASIGLTWTSSTTKMKCLMPIDCLAICLWSRAPNSRVSSTPFIMSSLFQSRDFWHTKAKNANCSNGKWMSVRKNISNIYESKPWSHLVSTPRNSAVHYPTLSVGILTQKLRTPTNRKLKKTKLLELRTSENTKWPDFPTFIAST